MLITAFGPFPGAPFNPTPVIAHALARRLRRRAPGQRIIVHVFHTSYATVDREFPVLLAEHRPDVLLMLGLAARTPVLRLECQARNTRSVLMADAGGERAGSRTLQPSGAAALRGRAPFAAILAQWRRARLPGMLSHSAGRYLCNYAYWRAAEIIGPAAPCAFAFLHVPLPRRGGLPRWRPRTKPSLTTADLVGGAEMVANALLKAARRA